MRVPSGYRLETHPKGLVIVITYGTEYMVSGVISMRNDLRTALAGDALGLRSCSGAEFGGHLGISKGSMLYGWPPMFHHWMAEHGVKEGDEVRVLLTDTHVECIEPWAGGDGDDETTSTLASEIRPTSSRQASERPDTIAPSSSVAGPHPSQPRRGSRVLVLSRKLRDLKVPRGSVTLGQRYGEPARVLAAEWLQKRPSGGRVWVDDQGRATTFIDGRLSVLGRVPTSWEW